MWIPFKGPSSLLTLETSKADERELSAEAQLNTESHKLDNDLDWVLSTYDPETTEAQSMKEELHRLCALKSYLVLDSEREEVFERITTLATRLFNVDIALISLVDVSGSSLTRDWATRRKALASTHFVRTRFYPR
jgi:hypothetical protein